MAAAAKRVPSAPDLTALLGGSVAGAGKNSASEIIEICDSSSDGGDTQYEQDRTSLGQHDDLLEDSDEEFEF